MSLARLHGDKFRQVNFNEAVLLTIEIRKVVTVAVHRKEILHVRSTL